MISSIYLFYQVLAVGRISQAISISPIEPLLSAAGGNHTTLKTQMSPAWVSSPGVRGTSDILWSCIVTLTACIYTAMHLNVPPPHEGNGRFVWRRSKWVALALFAPEVVLYCALTQLLRAWAFKKVMNKLWATQQASLDRPERKKSKPASPDGPDSHNEDNSNVVEQNYLPQVTQQNQAPSKISPLPLPKVSVPESKDNTNDEEISPTSGGNTGDEIFSQLPQRSLSIFSKTNADGQSGSKGFDLEKGMVTSPSQRFSLKYGLFVVMGGIVTHDVAKISDDVNGPIVLTPNALIQFARRGLFFDVSNEVISSKSKANLLGKGLVCIQVIWFLIQCIARAAAGYPLALLEVHTMVHVGCALLMYAFWWKKPQDISEPAVQHVSGDIDLLAALLTMSSISGLRYRSEAQHLVWYGKTALQDPLLDRPSNERRCPSLEPSDPQYEVKVLRKTPKSQILEPFDRAKGQVVALVPGQALSCGIGPIRRLQEKHGEQPITYLSAKDVLRWNKVSEWVDNYEHQNPRYKVALSQSEDIDFTNSLSCKSAKVVPRDALLVHVSDLPGYSSILPDLDDWRELDLMSVKDVEGLGLLILLFLPLIYGGIHLTTWNFHFASQTEHLLWKIACIDIMGTIPGCMAFSLPASLLMPGNYDNFRGEDILEDLANIGLFKNKIIGTIVDLIIWILLVSMIIFYLLSRIYIVVESFVSLRHVPIGVYAAIPWVQDIVHI
ncbi:hypothetical protein BDR22DRAFT_689841 [Usnea florida]